VILATAGDWVGRLRSLNRLQVGLVVLVAASAGLLAVQGDATPLQLVLSVWSGLFVGVGLVAYLRWIAPDTGGWH
jgi:hypothetical protein